MTDLRDQGFLHNNAVWLVVLGVVVVLGLVLFNGWDKLMNEKVDSTSTVTGSFTCLPLKAGVVSEEGCNLGVRAADGSYYALDISRIQDANTDLKAEETIAVTGFILPQTAVLGSLWEDYEVVGIIKVNTLLRTR